MEKTIQAAVALYSGNKPLALFVQKLPENIEGMNRLFAQISDLFNGAKIENFSKLPDDTSERNKFVKLFNEFNEYFSAAKVQGFSWGKTRYEFIDRETNRPCSVKVIIDEYTYNTLVKRYQELHSDTGAGNNEDDAPYDLDGYITTIDTDKIDSDYIVYVGRIDYSKGCDVLVNYFLKYKQKYPSDLKLVLVGGGEIDCPKDKDVIFTGFVSEVEKFECSS